MNKLLWMIPFALLVGCNEPAHEREPGPAAPAVAVNTVAASTTELPAIYSATGTVRARSTATVSAKLTGYARQVKVQVGDQVREGQLLIALDTTDLDVSSNRAAAAQDEVRSAIPEADSAVAAAKTNLDLAQSTFKRMSELYAKKSISDHEFDEASAKVKTAEASFEMARARRRQLDSKLAQAQQEVRATQITRGYAELRAPFAGLVTAKSVEQGNLATPGTPLLTIEGEGYRLEAVVEESRLTAIRVGHAVSVKLDGIDRLFEARVSEIVPAVDPASRAYTAKIDLPSRPELRSGLFGTAVFHVGSRSALTIPAAAVIERGQLQSVFVTDGAIARTRLVTLGEKRGDEVEVLSGLNAGEKLIAPVPQGLADGARVEVKP